MNFEWHGIDEQNSNKRPHVHDHVAASNQLPIYGQHDTDQQVQHELDDLLFGTYGDVQPTPVVADVQDETHVDGLHNLDADMQDETHVDLFQALCAISGHKTNSHFATHNSFGKQVSYFNINKFRLFL